LMRNPLFTKIGWPRCGGLRWCTGPQEKFSTMSCR